MKITEITEGQIYAYQRGQFGNPTPVRVLRKGVAFVAASSESFRHYTRRKGLEVQVLDPDTLDPIEDQALPGYGNASFAQVHGFGREKTPTPMPCTEARWIVSTWDDHVTEVQAAADRKAAQAAAKAENRARAQEYAEAIEALLDSVGLGEVLDVKVSETSRSSQSFAVRIRGGQILHPGTDPEGLDRIIDTLEALDA